MDSGINEKQYILLILFEKFSSTLLTLNSWFNYSFLLECQCPSLVLEAQMSWMHSSLLVSEKFLVHHIL